MSVKSYALLGMIVVLVLVGCHEPTPVLLEPLPTLPALETVPDSGWIHIFFTAPAGPDAHTYRGGPDAFLAQAIQGARSQVDLAVYHLDLWSIRDALIAAHQRGVGVRMVTERDNIQSDEVRALKQAGVEVVSDRGPGLMHQKFVVIDRYEVWSGSMNFTLSGGYRNDNVLIQIRSRPLADNYTVEFEEMFSNHLFGEDLGKHTPNPVLEIKGVMVETYFSPDDHPQERILELISGAQEEIHFLAYAFTSDPIAIALIEKANEGVTVRGVMEASQSYSGLGGEIHRLMESDVDLRLDGNPHKMHHKCILIDKEIVITGSYNFTRSAEERNDENILIIHDPRVASEFDGEFWRIYSLANP